MGDQAREPAHLRMPQGNHRGRDRAHHRKTEEESVGREHGGEASGRAVEHRDPAGDGHGRQRRSAEHDAADLDRGQRHRGHDHHVEEHPEVESAEAAQKGGRPAAVAQLVELHVGGDPGAAPQPSVDRRREHPGEKKGPPDPVSAHAVLAGDVGHEVRRVGGERRRHHREAQEPPGPRPSRQEKVLGAPSRAARGPCPDSHADREVPGDEPPIDRLEHHGCPLGGSRALRPCLRQPCWVSSAARISRTSITPRGAARRGQRRSSDAGPHSRTGTGGSRSRSHCRHSARSRR